MVNKHTSYIQLLFWGYIPAVIQYESTKLIGIKLIIIQVGKSVLNQLGIGLVEVKIHRKSGEFDIHGFSTGYTR